MNALKANTSGRHPIGVVSTRTGIPQDLIRAWERRYGAVTPQRARGGRRLYSDEDIERLRLLKRCVSAGRRISDVAARTREELEALVAEDDSASAWPVPSPRPAPRRAAAGEEFVAAALEAVVALDRDRVEELLSEAAVSMSAPSLRREVIVPLLDRIGERWREGTLRIVHEHMAAAIVRTFIGSLRNGHGRANAPRLIATTPAGQRHELGALVAAAAADEAGWSVYYLGPDLPAEEIAAAARQLDARAIAISIVYRDNDFRVIEELSKLRDFVGDSARIIVGGRAAAPVRGRIEALGLELVEDLAEFQDRLAALDR